MTQGVYVIRFQGTNQVYIGESVNVENRWKSHIDELARGESNYKLLEAYEQYGKPTFELIEAVSQRDQLTIVEAGYIKLYDSVDNGFNVQEFSHVRELLDDSQLERAFRMLFSYKLHSHIWIEKTTKIPIWHIKQLERGHWNNRIYDKYPGKLEEVTAMIEQREKKRTDKIQARLESTRKANISLHKRKWKALYEQDPKRFL